MSGCLIDPPIMKRLRTVRDCASSSLRSEAPNLYRQQSHAIAGIQLDSAICSHLEWRDKSEAFFAGGNEARLDKTIVGRDDLFPLGRWMKVAGRERLGPPPAFCQLEHAHADFYQIAGEIIATAQAGDAGAARARLDQGEDIDAPWRVVDAIPELAVAIDKAALIPTSAI